MFDYDLFKLFPEYSTVSPRQAARDEAVNEI